MGKIRGGKQVVDALKKEGVTHVFSISGGHIAPIYDALLDSDIKLITTRHEQAAAMMAGGWARATGQVGVVIVTAGPGFTNAITGIADAYMAGAPVVCISGSVSVDMADKLDLQDLDQLNTIKPVTNWARKILVPSRIGEAVHEAFKQARNGAPGPVYLEIPADVLGAEMEDGAVVQSKPIARPTPGLAPQEVDKVIEMIRAAKKPIIIAGSGVYYSNGAEQLTKFAEKSGIPTYTTSMGKGCMSDEHPLCFGPSLVLRPGSALAGLTQSDLIILVGTRISLFFMYGRLFSPTAKIIHLNINHTEIGRSRVPDLGLVADAGRALEQLTSAGAKLDPDAFKEWRASLTKAHTDAMGFFKLQLEDAQSPMHPIRLCKELDNFLKEDDILVLDGGDTQIWMNMVRSNLKPGRNLESGLFGCLGVGIPFGMAAAFAFPDRRVFVITGDGSVGFNFIDLHTAITNCLNLTVIVNNDNAWGMVKHSQMLTYGPERCCGVELGDVPYHRMLEAMGGKGYELSKIEEIRPALEDATKRGGVNLINVHVRPGVISPGSLALAQIGKKGGGY